MFAIFRKLDDDQDNGKLDTEEMYETMEEKIIGEENIDEENPSEDLGDQEPNWNSEEKTLSVLETMKEEEEILLTEKSQLLNMEVTLKKRIREDIEIKKQEIERLKQNNTELKQRCEDLAKVLNLPIRK